MSLANSQILDTSSSRTQLAGTFQVLLSAFFFSCMSIFAKIAYSQGITPLTLLTLRFVMAAIALWVYFSIFGARFLKCNFRQLLLLSAFGIIGYGTMSTLLFMSLERIPAALAIMIFYTHPALIVLLTWIFYKEPIDASRMTALLLTLSGCAFLLQISFKTLNWTSGTLLALGTSVTYAIYLTYGQRILKKINPRTVVIYVITSLAILFSMFHNPVALVMTETFSFKGWLVITAIAIFSTCLAILLLFSGMEKIGAAKASLISTLEPFSAVLMAYFLLGERLTFLQLVGGSLILLGVIVLELRHKTRD